MLDRVFFGGKKMNARKFSQKNEGFGSTIAYLPDLIIVTALLKNFFYLSVWSV